MLKTLKDYQNHSRFTAPKEYEELFHFLPSDVKKLNTYLSNWLIHKDTDKHALDPIKRQNTILYRKAYDMLKKLKASITSEHKVNLEHRLATDCRGFALLLCSALRTKDIPARLRFGFINYAYVKFAPLNEHAIVEYWQDEKWLKIDPRTTCETAPLTLQKQITPLPEDVFIPASFLYLTIKANTFKKQFPLIGTYNEVLWFLRNVIAYDYAAINKIEVMFGDRWGFLSSKPSTFAKDTKQQDFFKKLSKLDINNTNNYKEILQMSNDKNFSLGYNTKIYNHLKNIV